MKKYAPYVIVFLFALLLWEIADTTDFMTMHVDGEEFDGPLGAFLSLVLAGGGVIIAGFVMLVVGLVLAVVFAGLGVILLGALIVGAVALALAISPLLLPLLLPLALIWYLVGRQRRTKVNIMKDGAPAAQPAA
jgi:hypothetical protein